MLRLEASLTHAQDRNKKTVHCITHVPALPTAAPPCPLPEVEPTREVPARGGMGAQGTERATSAEGGGGQCDSDIGADEEL